MAPAEEEVAGAEAATSSSDGFFYRVRPCKFIVLEDPCPFGDSCFYAHTRAQLRPGPPPPPEQIAAAAHWAGDLVAIGAVEHAMFWDLAPPGTVDVVCNRASSLGNPFAARLYGPEERPPPVDAEGWCAAEHEELCAAFDEYLRAVLADDCSEGSLLPLVTRIGNAHRVDLSDTWLAQELSRQDVLNALTGLEERLEAGERLRLLCHCRPHVRCHTEFLKARLDAYVARHGIRPRARGPADAPPPEPAPGDPGFLPPGGPSCAARGGRCGRRGRALDPGDRSWYCTQCWIYRVNTLKEQGAAQGSPDVPLDPPCAWFARGLCKFGDRCYYRHEEPEPEQQASARTCRWNSWGGCRFGDACAYRHEAAGHEDEAAGAGAPLDGGDDSMS